MNDEEIEAAIIKLLRPYGAGRLFYFGTIGIELREKREVEPESDSIANIASYDDLFNGCPKEIGRWTGEGRIYTKEISNVRPVLQAMIDKGMLESYWRGREVCTVETTDYFIEDILFVLV